MGHGRQGGAGWRTADDAGDGARVVRWCGRGARRHLHRARKVRWRSAPDWTSHQVARTGDPSPSSTTNGWGDREHLHLRDVWPRSSRVCTRSRVVSGCSPRSQKRSDDLRRRLSRERPTSSWLHLRRPYLASRPATEFAPRTARDLRHSRTRLGTPMEFFVFRRAASALTGVPVLFQRPLDSRRHGITQQVGRRGVALDDFGPGVVRTRVGDGLARVGGA